MKLPFFEQRGGKVTRDRLLVSMLWVGVALNAIYVCCIIFLLMRGVSYVLNF